MSFKPTFHLLFVCIFFLFIQPAEAAYTVLVDDDLLPTKATESQPVDTHYQIPFNKNRSPLTILGRGALDVLIPEMRATNIHIIGRPDAHVYSRGKMANLATNRANNIRTYLVQHGVPYGNITIQIDNSPNQQENGNLFLSDLVLTNNNNQQTQIQTQPATYPPAPLPINTATDVSKQNTSSSDQVIRFINHAVESGQMASDVALKLIRQLIDSETRLPTVEPHTQQQAAQYIAPIRATQWTLTPDKNLKDNLASWAATENYTIEWNAANFYQLNETSYVPGNLLDAIDTVISSIGNLTMSVSNKKHIIYIADKK